MLAGPRARSARNLFSFPTGHRLCGFPLSLMVLRTNYLLVTTTVGNNLPTIPRSCTRWSDVCNTCQVKHGVKLGCTERFCKRNLAPKCLRFASSDSVSRPTRALLFFFHSFSSCPVCALSSQEDATGKMCGGFAGLRCPSGYTCVRLASRNCRGCADMGGKCHKVNGGH